MKWKRNNDGSYTAPGYVIYKRRVWSNGKLVVRFCLAKRCADFNNLSACDQFRVLADYRLLCDAKKAAGSTHHSFERC